MDLTQIDSQPEEYFLSCAKCQHDGGTGVCVDGVWFFDPRAGTYEGSESSSLFCCTSCISWFSKHSRNWFQDDIAREWIRITKSALRKWDRESWADSEEKSAAFVENITRKQSDKKTNQKKSKKTGRSSACTDGATSRNKRKRPAVPEPGKRPAVSDAGDSASLPSTSSFVMERYNPKTTFTSFQQGVQMLHAFLNMCQNADSTADNHISESVHNIVTMQVGLLETIMKTLQEHIR